MIVSLILTAIIIVAQTDGSERMDDEPTTVELAEIYEDPWAWHGRTVRLSGHTNFCYPQGCGLCQRDEGEEICAGLGRPAFGEGVGPEPRNGIQTIHDEFLRWASLTITARYDATCSGEQRPDAENYTICLDRSLQLLDPVIEAIHAYRPADDHRADPGFVRLEDEEIIEQALDLAANPFTDEPPEYDPRRWTFYRSGIEPGWYSLCRCRKAECEPDDWPRTIRESLDAPGNPYACSDARVRDGRLTPGIP